MVADSSSHQASSNHHHHSRMTNGKTGTSDIHDYNHQRQGRHQWQQQQQHNPVATIDTGYYADIVQQPVRVRCSEHYNNGIVTHPIEPCIAVQFHRKIQPDILGSRPLEVKVQQQVTPDHPLSKSEAMEQQYSLQQQLHASPAAASIIIIIIDHYPNSKRSVWTDITHRVLQSPLPSFPTASLFGNQATAADIATGKDGNRGVFFFFPDIGIRVPGQFKLRIVISRIPQGNCPHNLMNDQTHCTICNHSTQLAEVTTDIFISHPADTWGGPLYRTSRDRLKIRPNITPPRCHTRNPTVLSEEQSVEQCISSRPQNLLLPHELALQMYLSRPGHENPHVPEVLDYIILEDEFILVMEYFDQNWDEPF
ncbi:hypothetical protein BASA62_010090 [Batrachochytrium salamandrivorans]|nr:hypothetical protein BASA62_010090 [Batrachochytrium salamandrivorans]